MNVVSSVINISDNIRGSQEYNVSVVVTNISNHDITILSIIPEEAPGTSLSKKEEIGPYKIMLLYERHAILCKEIEAQVYEIFRKQVFRQEVPQLIFMIFRFFQNLFMINSGSMKLATNLIIEDTESLRIRNLEDVIRLERHGVFENGLDEPRILLFGITREKIQLCEDEIKATELLITAKKEESSPTISPQSNLSFPLKFKAPTLFFCKSFELHLRIILRLSEGQKIIQTNTKTVQIAPSPYAVPLGSAMGAVLGLTAKLIISSRLLVDSRPPFDLLLQYIGVVCLALIFSFITARSNDIQKPIVVEDFIGGIIIGGITGLFSNQIIERLSLLVK